MTNHHVGADSLQKLSTKEQDYVTTGFHAKTHADEVKCVDLELNVLHGDRGRHRRGSTRRSSRA